MATVFIPAQCRDLTGGVGQVAIEGSSIREIVAGLDGQFPGIAARFTQDGALMPAIAVSIDGAIASRGLLSAVKPESEIHFLPAIGGG